MALKNVSKKLLLMFVPLFLASLAWGQHDMHMMAMPGMPQSSSMSSTGQINIKPAGWASHLSDCASTLNCWYNTHQSGVYVSSRNHVRIVVDANNLGWTYNEASRTWTSHPEWGTVYGVQKAGDGNYYGMIPYANCPSHSASGKWNGANWVVMGFCAGSSLSVAADGGPQILIISGDGQRNPWISTNYGASFTKASSLSVQSVSSIDSTMSSWAAVKTDGTVWKIVNGVWTQVPGMTNAAKVDVDSLGVLYILDSGGNIKHYNPGTQTWDTIVGGGNSWVANGGVNDVWAVGPSGVVQRLADTVPQFTATYGFTVNCNVPPPYGQQICAQFNHTNYTTIHSGSANSVTNNGPSFYGPGSGGSNATIKLAVPHWFCQDNPTADACQIYAVGEMSCNGGGSNQASEPVAKINYEFAYSAVRFNAGPPTCGPGSAGDAWSCTYPATPDCTNTIAPDFNPPYVTTPNNPYYYSADVSSSCFSVLGAPWWCLGTSGTEADVVYTEPQYPGPIACTHNTPPNP